MRTPEKFLSDLSKFVDLKSRAVIAVADEKWGERPLAYVVLRETGALDEKALRSHLEKDVPRWQVPDRFVVVESLPRTSVGKIDTRELRRRSSRGSG